MKLSIVLCTYNNASSLALTLENLAAQNLSNSDDIELLVIDNNSPDTTQEVSQQFAATTDFDLHYHFVKEQGLSHARNRGLAESRGEYILFTDDDAIIQPDWVQNYLDAIERYNRAADCLFGAIYVHWDKPKPQWFTKKLSPYFASVDYGNTEFVVTDNHHEFFGKNFCVRKQVLEELGGFDPKLGRSGDKLIAGEETLIYKNLVARGNKVVYLSDVGVGHRLKEREYEYANIVKAFHDSAYTIYNISSHSNGRKFLGKPVYPLKIAIADLLLYPARLFKAGRNDNEKTYQKLRLIRAKSLLKVWLSA